MASDLMTAMLTGQNQSPLMADPNTMALIPQISLAQSMLQGSLSGAPAYPAQALGRLAQALVGGQMMGSIGQEAASAYDRSAQAMSKIYPAGTPIGDMLRSPDPYTKFQGVQMAGKAALINSENKPLEPGQRIVAPATPAAAGGVVASGSPAQAGAVEGAKEQGKIGAQFGDLIQPQGASMTPAQRMAAAPPFVSPGALDVNPLPPRPQPHLPPPADMRAAPRVNAPAPAPVSSAPVRTDHGTVIPPLADQVLPRTQAEASHAVESWQKTKDGWLGSMQPGYEAEQRLNTIADAFKRIQTGAWATEKADILAKLKSLGINLQGSDSIGDVEKALHENYLGTMARLKQSNSRWTQMEFKATSEKSEHPNLQPEANLQMLSEDIGMIRHTRDMINDWPNAQRNGWRDPNAYEASWMKNNPLKDYVERTKTEIGPLKGMPGAPGSPEALRGRFLETHPIRVNSPDEARKLPSGTPIVLPDGRPGRVP